MEQMHKHLSVVAVSMVVAVVLSGCDQAERRAAPATVEPTPPTAAEIQRELWKPIEPVVQSFNQELPLNAGQVASNLQTLQTALSSHRGQINAPEALREVASRLKDLVRQAHRQEREWYVVYFFDALRSVDPSSAVDVQRLRNEAQLTIDMPQPVVKGFVTDQATGQTIIFLDVHLPSTGTREQWDAREGDEKYNLRVIEIVGNNRCVRFEYMVTKKEFERCTEAARQAS
jgi:hypothetical protein